MRYLAVWCCVQNFSEENIIQDDIVQVIRNKKAYTKTYPKLLRFRDITLRTYDFENTFLIYLKSLHISKIIHLGIIINYNPQSQLFEFF